MEMSILAAIYHKPSIDSYHHNPIAGYKPPPTYI